MCVCVLHTCQAVDHFSSTFFIPLSSHTFFYYSTNTDFLSGLGQGLIYYTVELWERESFPTQGGQCKGLPTTLLIMVMLYGSCRWRRFVFSRKTFDVRGSDMHCRLRGDQNAGCSSKTRRPNSPVARRKRNKERRASVSSTALQTVLWLTVRSR